MARYIFVAGGVISGVGKGVATASIGKILKAKGFRVTAVKIDPYVNIDAGTMNPTEHGEVFVTQDGTECDQDIGNYERFLDQDLTTDNYITTGRVYQAVINRERNLEYDGRCVEVVPHIPEEVISRIEKAARIKKADFVLIEIGGTVGEYQNMLFLEAARMMKLHLPKDVLFILVSYLPIPRMLGEMKTKPTQHAVRALNMAGIQPDIILARSTKPLDEIRKRKVSIFCNVDEENVISAPDADFIYEIPLNFERENLGKKILNKFGLRTRKDNLKDWQKLVKTIRTVSVPVKIGIVGKYFESGEFTLMDSYISVIEAVKHAALFYKRKPEIHWLSAGKYERDAQAVRELKYFDGVIVPGGFGSRGVEGKIKAIKFCREQKIPFLGLCFGMQLSVVEFARNVCSLKKANSTEIIQKCAYPVIDVMPEQKSLISDKKYGGTMRLGNYQCAVNPGTVSFRAYQSSKALNKSRTFWRRIKPHQKDYILAFGDSTANGEVFKKVRDKGKKFFYVLERHRHRYEFNNAFLKDLERRGMVIAGINPQKNLVEIVEIKGHPFFVGTQFHPEFKSRPLNPHPLFREFVRVAIQH